MGCMQGLSWHYEMAVRLSKAPHPVKENLGRAGEHVAPGSISSSKQSASSSEPIAFEVPV